MTGGRTGRRKRGRMELAAAAALIVAAAVCRGVTEQELHELFDARRIPVDEAALRSGALEGMIRAVDRRARILTSGDIASWTNRTPAVAAEAWPEGILYVKLDGLYPGSGEALTASLGGIEAEPPNGVIVDLRAAGGDHIDAVTHIAGRFVEPGRFLYEVTDGRGEVVERCHAPTNALPPGRSPLAVLVSGETRGAGEVLAGVLGRLDRSIVIGSRTSGHEGLMERIPLSEDRQLLVTTRWVSLGSNSVALQEGLLPDIEVSETAEGAGPLAIPGKQREGKPLSEKARMDRRLMERVSTDPALRRATDILLGLHALGAVR